MASSGVYVITNVQNSKQYVGSAVNVGRRWGYHRRSLERGIHYNAKLQNAWRKYGAGAFEFSVVETVAEAGDLVKREQKWMDELRPWYNIAPTAGSCLGVEHSEDTRRKLSEVAKGREPINEATKVKMSEAAKKRGIPPAVRAKITAAITGRSVSEETRRKISEAHKGREHGPLPEETKRKISEAHKGRPFTEERRQQLAEANRTRGPASEVTRARISAAGKGRRHSEETRRKISEAHKGRTFTEEHRRRLSEVQAGQRRQPLSEVTRARISESMKKYRAAKREAETGKSWQQ